jgi:hypothetical protein
MEVLKAHTLNKYVNLLNLLRWSIMNLSSNGITHCIDLWNHLQSRICERMSHEGQKYCLHADLSRSALKKPSRKFNYDRNVVVDHNVVVDTRSGSKVPLEPKGLGLVIYLVRVEVVPLSKKPLLIR